MILMSTSRFGAGEGLAGEFIKAVLAGLVTWKESPLCVKTFNTLRKMRPPWCYILSAYRIKMARMTIYILYIFWLREQLNRSFNSKENQWTVLPGGLKHGTKRCVHTCTSHTHNPKEDGLLGKWVIQYAVTPKGVACEVLLGNSKNQPDGRRDNLFLERLWPRAGILAPGPPALTFLWIVKAPSSPFPRLFKGIFANTNVNHFGFCS